MNFKITDGSLLLAPPHGVSLCWRLTRTSPRILSMEQKHNLKVASTKKCVSRAQSEIMKLGVAVHNWKHHTQGQTAKSTSKDTTQSTCSRTETNTHLDKLIYSMCSSKLTTTTCLCKPQQQQCTVGHQRGSKRCPPPGQSCLSSLKTHRLACAWGSQIHGLSEHSTHSPLWPGSVSKCTAS